MFLEHGKNNRLALLSSTLKPEFRLILKVHLDSLVSRNAGKNAPVFRN